MNSEFVLIHSNSQSIADPKSSSLTMSKKPLMPEDLESGAALLHPRMLDSPELRWAFIRKVYSIVAIQLIATAIVSAVVVLVHPITDFIVGSRLGLAVYIAIAVVSLIVLCPLYIYRARHPVNYFLLAIFTVSISFSVGLTCAFTSGTIILQAAILTASVVTALTLYTFWAVRRGHDFNFLGPFLFGCLIGLIVFSIIQMFFPYNKVSVMIYEGLALLIFSAYIVYDTDNLIKRHTYDDYVWAAISLYLDIVNIFIHLANLLSAAER